MSSLPGTRVDIPMMPMPVYPANTAFMSGSDNTHINKILAAPVQQLHAVHIPAATAPPQPQEPVQQQQPHPPSTVQNKVGGEVGSATSISTSEVDPNRLKFWNTEDTIELIQLYKKYLPEFHKFGQRKMNVWQRVTEELVAKGFSSFSWAECSTKFRSLRDSYRRTTTGGRAHTWQYYPLMKEVMKMEKIILEQEPTTRLQKGTITCENEIRTTNLAFANTTLTANTGLTNNSSLANNGLANNSTLVTNNTTTTAALTNPQPSTSHSEDGNMDTRDCDGGSIEGKKRQLSDSTTTSPAVKKAKQSADQDSEIVIGKNFNGDIIKATTKKSALGALGSLQALGKSLSLPQTQLVVGDDGQVVQTTSAPTGLFVNESGQLYHNSQNAPARQIGGSMPHWFKMYEKRTRAENNRRLEELKEMHQESLELQRNALEVARQKNELLKNLTESLADFKSLLQR